MRARDSTVAFQYLCFVLSLLFVADVPPSQCGPQVYPYGIHTMARPPYLSTPLWNPFHLYAVPVGTRLVYVLGDYTQHALSTQPHVQQAPYPMNLPFFSYLRQPPPLKDFGVNRHVRPVQEQTPIKPGAAKPAPQCGRRAFTRSAATKEQQHRGNFQTRQSTGGEEGSVLLTSNVFEGPDLSGTVFEKYKGNDSILSTKITYGLLTDNEESPWQVAIFEEEGNFHCGASLISERHILTACHCVESYKNRPDQLQLSIGDWDLKSKADGPNIEAKVKKVIPHPNFNYFELQHDIAVLVLTAPVQFTDRIQPVCLPPSDIEVEGSLITVTGWGRNEKNLLQTKLHKLTAVVLENKMCADRWVETGAPRTIIGNGIMCMDAQYGDSCKGDSGGPACKVYPPGSGRMTVFGIVSFGSASCTDKFLPGVYTRVPVYKKWIEKQMRDHN